MKCRAALTVAIVEFCCGSGQNVVAGRTSENRHSKTPSSNSNPICTEQIHARE